MAFVVLSDGTTRTVTAEQGKAIWEVLNGEREPNEEQGEFCAKIKRVYLNRHNAPKSYLKRFPSQHDGDRSVNINRGSKARLPYKD